jgi:hypothetical protein
VQRGMIVFENDETRHASIDVLVLEENVQAGDC